MIEFSYPTPSVEALCPTSPVRRKDSSKGTARRWLRGLSWRGNLTFTGPISEQPTQSNSRNIVAIPGSFWIVVDERPVGLHAVVPYHWRCIPTAASRGNGAI